MRPRWRSSHCRGSPPPPSSPLRPSSARRADRPSALRRHAPSFARIDPERQVDMPKTSAADRRARDPDAAAAAEMMDTREVAAYLRLKERRIYDLVRQRAIPHVRATGKLLFPRAQVDA